MSYLGHARKRNEEGLLWGKHCACGHGRRYTFTAAAAVPGGFRSEAMFVAVVGAVEVIRVCLRWLGGILTGLGGGEGGGHCRGLGCRRLVCSGQGAVGIAAGAEWSIEMLMSVSNGFLRGGSSR